MLGLALLEVMDKEASIPGMWAAALLLGGAGLLLGRRSVLWPIVLGLLIALLGWGVRLELADPYVGPAILSEAGPWYPLHNLASTGVGFALCAAGLVRGRQGKRGRPSGRGLTGTAHTGEERR
ncbi:hypothetical protein HKM21_21580 [Longimicrobium terrae]|uniref:Uncharacterized protein n=2 Tax=Longimicrobium terrae TaxID=1639882 RepID=A0A841GSH9_9BACT|nr:hypothetical protein [Longimicrobium terrae]MBB6069329.1 hypothetical protein [Longimicrobium terrae]NNC31863.1 hypothetical protein [Longimicrobium terrae]